MVSLVSDEKTGTWLGASPELLVSVDRNGIFRTVALAGTQVYQDNILLRNIGWTQKEIEEQALVERYIISCFKKIRVREFDEHGPKTVQAGNLVHLKSDFEVDMKAVNFPLLGSVMLKLLHPTSAVCGMPMEASLSFLKQHEKHDREFYAGYLGPVNIENESGNILEIIEAIGFIIFHKVKVRGMFWSKNFGSTNYITQGFHRYYFPFHHISFFIQTILAYFRYLQNTNKVYKTLINYSSC